MSPRSSDTVIGGAHAGTTGDMHVTSLERRSASRKSRQLCSRVIHLLILILITACGDAEIEFAPIEVFGAPVSYDDSNSRTRIVTAVVSMHCDQDPDVNIVRMEGIVGELTEAHPTLRLVVFGEMTLGWYHNPGDSGYQERIGLTEDDLRLERLADLARRYDIYLAFGAGVVRSERLFNALLLLDPSGNLIAEHHKMQLTDSDRAAGYTAGEAATITEIDGVRVGLMVCSDIHSRSLLEDYGDADIDLLVLSLASGLADLGQMFDPIARRVGSWVAYANRAGNEGGDDYSGFVYISDPAGGFRARRSGEGTVVVDIGIHR